MARKNAEQEQTTSRKLRSDILQGVFSPGERLIELSLAERYRVGRGAVRAALVELRSEGLVEIEANRGATVRRIGLDEAIEIAEARQVLETLIAGRAAASGDVAAKEALNETIGAMRSAVARDDSPTYSELNRLLHEQIWEIGGHQVANDLVRNLRDRSARHQFRLAIMPGRPEESVHQHAAIVEAIRSGDVGGAEEAMSRHLDSVIELLRRWFQLGADA